jgi:hypothetical protein
MKNLMEIKQEAKEQIMKLLDMCGCYVYKEEHIDTWLDVWEKNCSSQIENIAEKSPFYDGKCKIVFPSQYPREINAYGIAEFCRWLNNWTSRNLEPVKFCGLTLEEAKKFRNFCYALDNMPFNNVINMEGVPASLNEHISALAEICQTSEYWDFSDRCNNAYHKFQDSYDVVTCDGKVYSRDEYYNSGACYARTLSEILSYTYSHTQFLNEQLVENFSYHFSKCKFSVGQKLSRAVNNIAKKYEINKDPEWNKEFAKYSDCINPLNVTKWTVISWHPIDYLTFCFGNSWSSCSNIDKRNVRGIKIGASRSSVTSYVDENYVFRGEHASAALSYMFDKTSFIYYTVNHKYEGTHYEEQDKESRIVFSFNEQMDTLLQSRLYPQCNDDNQDDSSYRIPREIVQKVIADALNIPNLWKNKKGSSVCCEYGISSGVHYADYADRRNKNCNISWLGDEPHEIHIGHNAICPNCGITHNYTYSLNCSSCDPDNN